MPRRRTLSVKKNYSISGDKYNELFYFCKQYKTREKEIEHLRGLTEVVMDGMPKGNTTSDPTFRKADKILRLRAENELIEQTAIEADPYIYQAIIKNVTEGIGFDYLDSCYSSRGTFYDRRRKFFYLLSQKR